MKVYLQYNGKNGDNVNITIDCALELDSLNFIEPVVVLETK